jgi:hypothetical protein
MGKETIKPVFQFRFFSWQEFQVHKFAYKKQKLLIAYRVSKIEILFYPDALGRCRQKTCLQN